MRWHEARLPGALVDTLSTIKNCDKTFLTNILRLLKNDDVSKSDKRHYHVKKRCLCKLQSIHTKITMGDKKLYRKKRTIVIKKFSKLRIYLDI